MNGSFGERVSPVAAIRAILHDYPFSASILRELLQNSDDAKATKQVRAVPLILGDLEACLENYRFLFSTWGKTLR